MPRLNSDAIFAALAGIGTLVHGGFLFFGGTLVHWNLDGTALSVTKTLLFNDFLRSDESKWNEQTFVAFVIEMFFPMSRLIA